jgi:hypothetical protein
MGDVRGKDQCSADDQEHHRAPIGGVEVDPRDHRRQRSADDQRQNHGQERHRVGRDEGRTREDRRDDRRLGRPEELADGGKDEGDQEQMHEIALQTGHECRERDERNDGGSAEVAPHHDLLPIHAVGNDSGGWREQHGRDGVGEQGDRDRRATARDLVRKDDQREEQELVRQLRRELGEPDVPERGVPEDRSKAACAFEGKADWLLHLGARG